MADLVTSSSINFFGEFEFSVVLAIAKLLEKKTKKLMKKNLINFVFMIQ